MEKTIKGKEVIAYKGMNKNMYCKGFQYEIGETYKTDNVKINELGFHACLNPRDVLGYYSQDKGSRYFKVKLSGDITKCGFEDTKVAATEITILEEINIDEAIKTEWWKNDNVIDLLYWSEGFARIKRSDKKYNYINKDGNILSKEWFRYAYYFHEGFAIIQKGDGLWNYIDNQGNYLSDEWFINVYYFHEGFAIIQKGDGLWNYIDKKGNYISDKWFYDVYDFHDGVAIVQREDELYNFIDKQGNILCNEWFSDAYSFHEGFANIQRTNGEWVKIDKTGKLLES